MAGRGTDIALGEGVREAGGLFVIGTERHESRRIDNQLRGRSGRQGDPGRTKFYLSLEDDLMRIFASDRLSAIMSRLGMKEGEAIISPMVSRAIEKAQKRVEEQNFSSRKHVLEYDDIMNQQRTVVYGLRKSVLEDKFDLNFMNQSVKYVSEAVALKYSPDRTEDKKWDLEGVDKELEAEFHMKLPIKETLTTSDVSVDSIMGLTSETVMKSYEDKVSAIPQEVVSKVSAYVYLQVIDQNWKDHLKSMDELQESVRLRGYGQRDPLQEYKKEAYNLFEALMNRIEDETALTLIRMPAPEAQEEYELAEPEMSEMQFQHPEAEAMSEAQNSGPVEKDGMIYHGSRGEDSEPAKVQQVVREGEKVGRNDPCPCGSGKKIQEMSRQILVVIE